MGCLICLGGFCNECPEAPPEDSEGKNICPKVTVRRQVILYPCAHVYHQNCLQSYEKFSESRNCPLCRAEYYDCAPFGTFEDHKVQCALRIQRAYRGFLTRRLLFFHYGNDQCPLLWRKSRLRIMTRQREAVEE